MAPVARPSAAAAAAACRSPRAPVSPSRGWRSRRPSRPAVAIADRRRRTRRPALEPIDLPPAIEQGVDMIYIDEELVPRAVHDNGPMADMTLRRVERRAGRPLHLGQPDLHRPSPRPGQISAALGRLAAGPDPAGPTLKPGSTGERVALLRDAARASAGDSFDRRSPRRSRNSRRSTASRTTASPAPARSRRSTAAPNIMSS